MIIFSHNPMRRLFFSAKFFTHDEVVLDLAGLYRCSQSFPESSISIMHSFAGNHIIFKGIFMTTSHYSSHPLPAYLPRPLLSYMALSTWSSLKHTDLEPQKVPSMKNTPKKEILCRYSAGRLIKALALRITSIASLQQFSRKFVTGPDLTNYTLGFWQLTSLGKSLSVWKKMNGTLAPALFRCTFQVFISDYSLFLFKIFLSIKNSNFG